MNISLILCVAFMSAFFLANVPSWRQQQFFFNVIYNCLDLNVKNANNFLCFSNIKIDLDLEKAKKISIFFFLFIPEWFLLNGGKGEGGKRTVKKNDENQVIKGIKDVISFYMA